MLFLASQSPRRRQLLEQIGVAFSVLEVDIPEVPQPGEAPEDYVRRVAREKAGAGLLAVVATPNAVVLAADTEVVLDGEVFGKPRDVSDAAAMLSRLAGRTHRVLSSVVLISAGREQVALHESAVTFAPLDRETIDDYVASGEPLGRAGAYAIQGRAAAFITHLSGSHSGVMGLPLHETARLLHEFGVRSGLQWS